MSLTVQPLCAQLKLSSPLLLPPKFWPPAGRHHELFPCYFPAWSPEQLVSSGVWEEQSRADRELTRAGPGDKEGRGCSAGEKLGMGAGPAGGSGESSTPKEAIKSAIGREAGRG